MNDYFKGKTIALFGNSDTLLDKKRPSIDRDYDIIMRLNLGSPKGIEECIGSRTDVIGLSMDLNKEEIDCLFDLPEKIIYFTPKKREVLNSYLKNKAYFFPKENWDNLRYSLDARPSTGCMAIYYLCRYCDFYKLDIYGFDFMETKSFYKENIHLGEHNYNTEKKFIKWLVKQDSRIELK